MYLPAHFEESRVPVLHALMREHPFATLVTQGNEGIAANHLPLHLAPGTGSQGLLQGHVARANPLWRDADGQEVLAIFHGPQAYVTPSWYPTKHEHGKAVPTWNYVVVHARGHLRAVDDTTWLRHNLEILVAEHERGFTEPWQLADAPGDYLDGMLRAIVGIEIELAELKGKWKLSQNQPAANRAGVVEGLRGRKDTDATAIAELIATTRAP